MSFSEYLSKDKNAADNAYSSGNMNAVHLLVRTTLQLVWICKNTTGTYDLIVRMVLEGI